MDKNADDIEELDVTQAKELINSQQAVVIDVRAPLDYDNECIEGAIHLTPDNLKDFIDQTDKSKTIICYCYFGNSSLGVCAMLKDEGFIRPVSLKGGFDAWKNS